MTTQIEPTPEQFSAWLAQAMRSVSDTGPALSPRGLTGLIAGEVARLAFAAGAAAGADHVSGATKMVGSAPAQRGGGGMSEPPLWEVMRDAYYEARNSEHGVRHGYADEIRAIANQMPMRFRPYLPEHSAVAMWLRIEADRAERGEATNA